jgi:hypothetical protein
MSLEVSILERRRRHCSRRPADLADLKEDIAVMSSLTDRLLQVAKAGVNRNRWFWNQPL